MIRCSPTVAPALPPTGVAGVGSLKPTPGRSVLTRTKLAAWAPSDATPSSAPATSALKEVFMGSLLRVGGVGGNARAVMHDERTLGVAGNQDLVEVVERAADRGAAIGVRD